MDPDLNSTQQTTTPGPVKVIDPLAMQQNVKKTSTIGYLFWSLAVPPFTTFLVMYLAWKKGVLHQLMPIVTITYTVLFALWSMLMFSAPGAFSDYFHQSVVSIPMFDEATAIMLTLAGIIFGIYFKIQAKRDGKLVLTWVGLMSTILLLQIWAGVHQLSFISVLVSKAQNVNIGL